MVDSLLAHIIAAESTLKTELFSASFVLGAFDTSNLDLGNGREGMKAAVYEKYGPPEVLHLKEVAKPIPEDNEVLIKVHATTVTKYDTWLRASIAPTGFWLPSRIDSGLRAPKQPILGTELAGEVEAVGKSVTRFEQYDQVFAFSGMTLGAYAEYICLPEDVVAMKPANLTYQEAAAVLQGALTALHFLRKTAIERGQKVLVFGASGGVGAYLVQLSKHFGAEVTGVCSTAKLHMVKTLGADHVIDYTREDFTQTNKTYDIIFDTIAKTPVFRTQRLLNKAGYYAFITFGLPRLIQALGLMLITRKKVVVGVINPNAGDLIFLRDLIEAGQLKVMIDRCYPIEKAAEAHRYVESGHQRGHVVIQVVNNEDYQTRSESMTMHQQMGETV